MMYGSLKVTSSGEPTLLETTNIKFDTETPVISGWNIWTNGAANATPFLNTLGDTTGVKIVDLTNTALDLATYSAALGDANFPNAVINRLVYTSPDNSKSMKLTGLDNTKTYDLMFGSFAGDAGPEDNTDFIVQGVTKFAAVELNNIVYKTSFLQVAPVSGEISIIIQGSPLASKYGCFNGLILRKYTP